MKRRKSYRSLRAEMLEARLNMAALTVNSTADGIIGDAVLTLREAVALVNNGGNANAALGRALTAGETAQVNTTTAFGSSDTINFAAAVNNQTITLANSRLIISRAVSINGPGADTLTIIAAANRHHFFIDGRTNGVIAVNISGLKLTEGNANGGGTTTGGIDNGVRGGAIFNDSGTVVVDRVYFQGNRATFGGAVFNLSGNFTLRDSTLAGNTAASGGSALTTNLGTVSLTQSTVSGNNVTGTTATAGAIQNSTGGTININQSTIAENIFNNSTGYAAIYSPAGATTTMTNTIVLANQGFFGNVKEVHSESGSFVTATHCYFGNGAGVSGALVVTDGVNNNIVGTITELRFALLPLAMNGGTIPTHLPIVDSPLLDKGANGNAPGGVDQRGSTRIVDGPDANTTVTIDIGAVEGETAPPFVVNLATDEDDGFYGVGDLSLREAIRLANGNLAANTINFAPGVTTILVTIGKLTLTASGTTKINGGGVIVEQSGTNVNGILWVDISAIAEVNGLTIRNGSSPFGGIYNSGWLAVTNSTLSGNLASTHGGGIYNSGTLTVTNSTLSGNMAVLSSGGGIYNTGWLAVTNSTLSGNSATASGGAIYNSGTLTITNSTLTNNRADSDGDSSGTGGGVSTLNAANAFTTLKNTIVAGNFVGTGTTVDDLSGINIVTTSTNNLIGDAGSAGGLTNNVNGNNVGYAVASVLNPTLANNGGPTLTHALVANSPAFNAGLNVNIPNGVTTDQRGAGFTRILEGTVDIGAVEQSFAPVINSNLTSPTSEQPITYTVNLIGSPTPTGTVTMVVNNVSGVPANLVAGQVQVTLNSLPVGLHQIFARYSGDANYAAADSAVLNQQVYSPSDLNRTGAVDITDVLIEVFYFNTYANQLPIAVGNLPDGPPFVDASGDGLFDIKDLLRVVFDYNVALANPEGEFTAVPLLSPAPSPFPPTTLFLRTTSIGSGRSCSPRNAAGRRLVLGSRALAIF